MRPLVGTRRLRAPCANLAHYVSVSNGGATDLKAHMDTEKHKKAVRDVKLVSVMEGGSVSLQTGVTEILRDDQILWTFGDQDDLIATLKGPNVATTWSNIDLNKQTGDLNITNIRKNQFGDYKVEIITSSMILRWEFHITSGPGWASGAVAWTFLVFFLLAVAGVGAGAGAVAVVIYYRRRISKRERQMQRTRAVTEGEPVFLIPYGIEILKDDDIQWKFRKAPIAERKEENGEITVHDDVHDGIFKDRLELDQDSGSLTITDIRFTMSGRYELRIIRRGRESFMKTFSVSVFAKTDDMETVSVKEGDPVTLSSGVTEIQRDDQIQWKFGLKDPPIARIKGGITKTFPSAAGGGFRDRLKLDQNGSLTIENIRPKDAGLYHLCTKSGKSIKLFRVDVLDPSDPEEGMHLMGIP